MPALVILAHLLVAVLEVPAMLMNEQRRELLTFWCVLLLSLAFCFSLSMGWPVPSPTTIVEFLFRPIAQAIGMTS